MITGNGMCHLIYDGENELIIDLKEVVLVGMEIDETSKYWDDSKRAWGWRFNLKFLFKGENTIMIFSFKHGCEDVFKEISDYLLQRNDFSVQPTYSIRPVDTKTCNIWCNRPITMDTDIEDINFSIRVLNGLRRANIHTVCDLLKYEIKDLLKFSFFGKRSLREVDDFVQWCKENQLEVK